MGRQGQKTTLPIGLREEHAGRLSAPPKVGQVEMTKLTEE